MQTKESTHPADLWSFELRWIDVVLPQEAPALAYDASAQTLLDGLILKIIKSADADAAKAMCALSLGFAAAQSTLEPRVFWKICAAWFESVSLGLGTADVYTKRAASQILLAFRKLARGEPDISGRLVHDLLFYCAQTVPRLENDAPILAAVRGAFGLTQPDSFNDEAPQSGRLDPVRLPQAANPVENEPEESSKVIGSLRVGIALYNSYLNEADEWSRRLLTELSEWALELHRPIAQSTIDLVRLLVSSSAKIEFFALAELAQALQEALQQVQILGQADPEHVKVFIDAAEDIRRLLHQFAAGFLKRPDQTLFARLKP